MKEHPLVEKREADILLSPLPFKGTIVLCYHTICRLSDPLRGLEHLVASIAPGGILSVNLDGCVGHHRNDGDTRTGRNPDAAYPSHFSPALDGLVQISDLVYYRPR